jgi:recombination associated protein RdgC
MRIIRNLITYKATLPAADLLAGHLAEKPFIPVLESHQSSSGFIQHPHTEQFVSPIAGGYSFRYRRDSKPISVGALRLAQSEKISLRETELGRELTKEEAEEIKVSIFTEALKTTLPERTEIDVFYHIESRTLMIPATSKDLASYVVYSLIEACGAVETSTIHISDVKGGLTKRLTDYYRDEKENAFEGFAVGDSVVMKGESGRAGFDLDNLDHARQGLIEALRGGMLVERLELVHKDAVSFRLTKDFHLRAIAVIAQEDDEEQNFETMAECWTHHAGVQVLLMVSVIQDLCDLFGYKETEKSKPALAA